MKYKFHFQRLTTITTFCLFVIAALCQSGTIDKPIGNRTLQKIIEVREARDSNDKKQDSLMAKLNKAIAVKQRRDVVKKNK